MPEYGICPVSLTLLKNAKSLKKSFCRIGSYLWSWQRAHCTRQPEKRRAEGVDAVGDVLDAVLLRDDAAFLALHVIAVEGRREALFGRRVGQQVTGELPGDELVHRHVAVERLDHPVAPRRHLPHAVVLIAVRVGVPGDVEPVGRHALAERRRGQQAIDHLLERIGAAVGEEGIDLGDRSAAVR